MQAISKCFCLRHAYQIFPLAIKHQQYNTVTAAVIFNESSYTLSYKCSFFCLSHSAKENPVALSYLIMHPFLPLEYGKLPRNLDQNFENETNADNDADDIQMWPLLISPWIFILQRVCKFIFKILTVCKLLILFLLCLLLSFAFSSFFLWLRVCVYYPLNT